MVVAAGGVGVRYLQVVLSPSEASCAFPYALH